MLFRCSRQLQFYSRIMDIFVILSSILAIIVFPLFVLLVSPVLLIHFLLSRSILHPISLGRVLSPLGAIYHSYNSTTTNSRNSIVVSVTFHLDGNIGLETFQNYIWKNLIQAKNETGDRLLYPEFQQFPSKWLGFTFWKWDTNFSIQEHIMAKVINKNSGETVDDVKSEFWEQGFTAGKSPWSVLLINGLRRSEETLVVLNFDHVLSDGVSLFKALLTLSPASSNLKMYAPVQKPIPILNQILSAVSFPMRACLDTIQINSYKKKSPTYIPPQYLPKVTKARSRIYVKHSKVIPTALLADTSRRMDLPFTAIILAGLTGGLHRHLVSRNITPPAYIVALLPVPVNANPSAKLTNSFTHVDLLLPVGETCRKMRLAACKNIFDSAKRSTIPVMRHIVNNIVGRMYSSWIKKMYAVFLPEQISISIFPGPQEEVSLNGCPILDITYNESGSYLIDFPMITVFIYNGGIRISVAGSDTSLGTEADIQGLLNIIELEFDEIFEMHKV